MKGSRTEKIRELKRFVKSGDLERLEKHLQEKYPKLTISWIHSNYYLVVSYKREMKRDENK